jgi:hypothetical protein
LTDDLNDHTFKREFFEKVVVTTYINPIPEWYSFSKVMQELNYKDFVEFAKDNSLVIRGT